MPKRKLAVALAAAMGLFVTINAAAAQDQPVSQGGWAVVSENGSLQRGLNVRKVAHLSQGVYQVLFNQDINVCAATATIRGERENLLPGYIVVSNFHSNKVQVNTYDTVTRLPTDLKFNVLVSC
jgi:hypothetical protein